MSLLEKASLIITPNGYKAGKLYSVIPNTALGDMDVVRATTATRVNSLGLIENVGLNVPRLDYTNGICPSILVEPQRTNLLTYSEDFSNSNWTKNNASITSNVVTSPNNTLTADKLIPIATASVNKYIWQNPTTSNGVNHSLIVFAKLAEYDILRIEQGNNSEGAWFNLSNGTIGSISSGATAEINNMGNGWYRCSVNTVSIATNVFFLIGGSNTENVQVGDGTSGIYIWGAQLEQGAYPTSYIPTVASTVTRNYDVISKTNSFIANKTVACLFIDLNRYYYASDYVGILGYRNGTTCDLYMLQYQNSDVTEFRAKSANGVQNSINLNVSLGHSKIAMYRENDKLSIFINGIKIIEQTSVSPMNEFLNSPQPLRINTDPFFGSYDAQLFINSAQIYTTILTDQECINLTTL